METWVDFPMWLQQELDRRAWTQADLSRVSGLTTAAISRIMDGSRKAGPEACRAIARALGIPEEVVFRKAGLLSPKPDDEEHPPGLLRIIWAYFRADPETRRQMEDFAEWSAREKRKPEPRPGEEHT